MTRHRVTLPSIRTNLWLLVGGGHGWRLRRLWCDLVGHRPDARPHGAVWCERRCGWERR